MDVDASSDPYAPPKADLGVQEDAPRRSGLLSVMRVIAIIGNVLLAMLPLFVLFALPRTLQITDYIFITIIVMLVVSSVTAIWRRNRLAAWAAFAINGLLALLLLIAYWGNANPSAASKIGNMVIGGLVAVNMVTVVVDILIKSKSPSGK